MTDAVDALFTLPPSEFIAARNALVKQLLASLDPEVAQVVTAGRLTADVPAQGERAEAEAARLAEARP